MDFKDLKKGILKTAARYEKEHKLNLDENAAVIKLFEEVGEFAEALLIHRKKSRPEKHLLPAKSKVKLSEELADIIGMVIINANHLDIDLERAIKNKWINRNK
ncbi:MAG: hypothetical protein HY432_01295 [Candidatus Liptonbacteria bacterium]|nr:hypothetical protein [Candidatus Liptonbacteria bacterium]